MCSSDLVGGESMAAQGLRSLYPIEDLAVMGFAEVLPRLATILRRLRETERAVATLRPDVVVTIENDGLTQPIGAPGLGTRWLDQVSRTDWQLQPIDSGGMRLRVRLADVIPVEHS